MGEKINTMINTLMLFLSPEERNLCSHVRDDDCFIPNLLVQGMRGDFDKTITLQSIRTTFVIDVSKMTIFQICAIRQHAKAREMFASHEIDSIEKGSHRSISDFLKEDNLFKLFKEPAYLVCTLTAH